MLSGSSAQRTSTTHDGGIARFSISAMPTTRSYCRQKTLVESPRSSTKSGSNGSFSHKGPSTADRITKKPWVTSTMCPKFKSWSRPPNSMSTTPATSSRDSSCCSSATGISVASATNAAQPSHSKNRASRNRSPFTSEKFAHQLATSWSRPFSQKPCSSTLRQQSRRFGPGAV